MLTIRGTAESASDLGFDFLRRDADDVTPYAALRRRLEQEQQQLEGTASRLSVSAPPTTDAADPIPSTSTLADGSPVESESHHGETARNGKEENGTTISANTATEPPSPPPPSKPAKPWALAAYGIPGPDPSILPDATLEVR